MVFGTRSDPKHLPTKDGVRFRFRRVGDSEGLALGQRGPRRASGFMQLGSSLN